MIKAVFTDYTGTLVSDWCDELDELLDRIYKNSSIEDKDDVFSEWVRLSKEYEENSYMDSYINEDDICMKILMYFKENYSLMEDMKVLKSLISAFLNMADIYSDVKVFFRMCPVPVYIISNNGFSYVSRAMSKNDIHPAGIISADDVRAYKPRREIFEAALRLSGCSADEVIHIGDSYRSDYVGATDMGIHAVLLDRNGKYSYDVPSVSTLIDLINLINAYNK